MAVLRRVAKRTRKKIEPKFPCLLQLITDEQFCPYWTEQLPNLEELKFRYPLIAILPHSLLLLASHIYGLGGLEHTPVGFLELEPSLQHCVHLRVARSSIHNSSSSPVAILQGSQLGYKFYRMCWPCNLISSNLFTSFFIKIQME